MKAIRTHKNYTSQTDFTNEVYNKLTWSTADYNEGVEFSDSSFVPVPMGGVRSLIHFSGQVWISQNATASSGGIPNYVVKVSKNGEPIFAGIGTAGSFANSFVITVCGDDIAEPGDIYETWLYVTNESAIVDANPFHTFLCLYVIEGN